MGRPIGLLVALRGVHTEIAPEVNDLDTPGGELQSDDCRRPVRQAQKGDVDVGNVGFTFNYQVTDNVALRTSYLSNVFGDDNLDNSILKMMFAYGWNRSNENAKKLMEGH